LPAIGVFAKVPARFRSENQTQRGSMHLARTLARAFATALLAASVAKAQDYPTRPITMIVPYAAGGGLDVLARTLAPRLAERLGKSVVVENRTGAGTSIGAAYV